MANAFAELDTNPSARKLREFALVVLIGFGVIAAVLAFAMHREHAARVVGAIGVLLAVAAFVPGLGRIVHVAWMGLGIALGLVTSPVVLFLCYVLVVVPTGLALRAVGKDPMRRELDPDAATYWEPHPGPDEPASYFRQF